MFGVLGNHKLARLISALVGLLFCPSVPAVAQDQVPTGFHWVNFKREGSTVLKIEQALKDEDYAAIREIGLTDSFALVMTVQRESGQTTFYGDAWRVYNVSTKTWDFQSLIYGYDLEVKDWIRFQSHRAQDLGVVYKDCWECEPASLFTALHYDPQKGWRARWSNDKDPSHPGITIEITDVGDPYTNEDVDQVFAVFAPQDGIATVGTWYHSRELATGKISENATKFWVDQPTGQDRSAELRGSEAKTWEVKLCSAKGSPYGLHQGQSSPTCRRIARVKDKTSQ